MIESMTLKAVQELLHEKGIEQRTGERMGDYIARGLGLTDAQAHAFLTAIDEGRTVDEACAVAGVSPDDSTLTGWAKAIGTALGKTRNRIGM